MDLPNYSVLMSVYHKENPAFFDISLSSIYNQTYKTNNFVLILDGPLTKELDEVVDKYSLLFGSALEIIRLEENKGLGNALNIGLAQCKNEIVLRADSDDFSAPNRAEKQIQQFINENVDISSCNIYLFEDSINEIKGERNLPSKTKDIIKFSKSRSPFNHPSVIFKKSAVINSGSYMPLLYKEDYYLWVRMIANGCKVSNISDHLVYMRVNDGTFAKRINKTEYKNHKWLFRYMYKTKYIGFFKYQSNLLMIFLKQYLPKKMVKFVFTILWKRKNNEDSN